MRAVWLSTIWGLDWPRSSSEEAQKRELDEQLDLLRENGINTIFLQVRGRGDVIYPSAIEPMHPHFYGKRYDPLAYAVEACHKRGMTVHAWITTLPIAAAISFVTWWVAKWASTIGGDLVWGGILLTVILAIGGGYMFYRAQLQPVHRDNVNDDWDPIDGPEGPQTGPTGPAHIVDTTHGLNHHLGK